MFILIYYPPHEGSCSQHVLPIQRPKCSNREDSPLYEFGHQASIFPCLDHIIGVRGDVHPGVLMLFQIVNVYVIRGSLSHVLESHNEIWGTAGGHSEVDAEYYFDQRKLSHS
jgi:hypothetical protein